MDELGPLVLGSMRSQETHEKKHPMLSFSLTCQKPLELLKRCLNMDILLKDHGGQLLDECLVHDLN